jgi:hypothetical protein
MPESAKAIATKERREEYEKECEREKLEEEAAERIRSIRIVPKSPDELYRGLGLDPDLVRDAKREAELKIQRTSKYAWVGLNVYNTAVKTRRWPSLPCQQAKCQSGCKYALAAGEVCFSVEEYPDGCGEFFVSFAKRKGAALLQKERSSARKTSGYTFPYHPRRSLFAVASFEEAIHYADALVEKMITSKELLSRWVPFVS